MFYGVWKQKCQTPRRPESYGRCSRAAIPVCACFQTNFIFTVTTVDLNTEKYLKTFYFNALCSLWQILLRNVLLSYNTQFWIPNGFSSNNVSSLRKNCVVRLCLPFNYHIQPFKGFKNTSSLTLFNVCFSVIVPPAFNLFNHNLPA